MDNKIKVQDVTESLANQIADYSIRLAHADALIKKKDKLIKELEMENKQLHQVKEK